MVFVIIDLLILRVIVSCIGVIGNSVLILSTFQTKFSRIKSFELFLLALASVNLEELLIVNIYDLLIFQTSIVKSGTWMCRTFKFLTMFGESASILMTVLISIFRYQKLRDADKRVSLPIYLDSIRSALMMIGICVMLSTLLCIPTLVIRFPGPEENITRKGGCPPDFFQCSTFFCPIFNRFYKYLFLVSCNMVPLIIVTVSSWLIITVLLKQRKTVTTVVSVSGSGSNQYSRRSKGPRLHRSTIAVLGAMALFQIDWTLYLIFQLTLSPTKFPFWAEMEFFISTSYTAISPYVYGIGNNLFSLKNIIKK
ncbi:hypothetical protein D5F01_LYC14979 [Larimichthys crocea]|uniref:G-protein coupled receptors family 1 profile domain-containing protein n=1 Tax=Larimichthys crocea TaxID=215358 RepID=A0A6G0I6V8_LARCR|nr:gonadotropin-releasing hormone receptor [Larimichthys crocea]KAE8287021.1 hypothetical protein D5F01_LYC14979 [Larimichthys crocea]